MGLELGLRGDGDGEGVGHGVGHGDRASIRDLGRAWKGWGGRGGGGMGELAPGRPPFGIVIPTSGGIAVLGGTSVPSRWYLRTPLPGGAQPPL